MPLDKIDLNIIKVLQQDGRITNQKLADQVALSPSACLERTKKLEQNGQIRGYQTDIAIEKIAPYSAVLVEITLKNHRAEDFQRFEKSIADIPEIVEIKSAIHTGGNPVVFLLICTRISRGSS